MSDPETTLLQPRKIAIQLVGFLVGIALLAWCIRSATAQGGWERLRDADPALLLAMLACTLVSSVVNGAIFWATVQGLKPLRFMDLQWLNFAGGLLNYAPIRLGAITRIAHHVRIDRLGLLQVGAWFTFIMYTLGVGVGACLLATIVRDRIDGIWALIVIGQVALGGILTRAIVGNRLLAKHGQGVDRLVARRSAVWVALVLRMVDLAMFAGRMGIAIAILGIELEPSHVVILAIVAYAANLIPFGRLGFREFCVAAAADRLSMLASDVEQNMAQLALVDSAAEAIVFIPMGILGVLWLRARWKRGPDPSD